VHELPVADWLSRLADRTPTPGGGAAAALAAATSAALVGMVTSYTIGGKWADREPRMREINAEAARLRADALQLAEDDDAAFGLVGSAYGMPKETPEQRAERTAAIQKALIAAAEPPSRVGELAARLVELAGELVDTGNPNVVSDVAVAASSARAALDAAVVNIMINRQQIRDEAVTDRLDAAVADAKRAAEAAGTVFERVMEKLNG
jgi:formiminotetrahydrofolate cyclodeaminase